MGLHKTQAHEGMERVFRPSADHFNMNRFVLGGQKMSLQKSLAVVFDLLQGFEMEAKPF